MSNLSGETAINLQIQCRILSKGKLVGKWQIRVGENCHDSTLDDTNVLILDVIDAQVHPYYDDVAAYFAVGILTTKPVQFSQVLGY